MGFLGALADRLDTPAEPRWSPDLTILSPEARAQFEHDTAGVPPDERTEALATAVRAAVTSDHAALARFIHRDRDIVTRAVATIDRHLRELAAGAYPVLLVTLPPQEGKTTRGRAFVGQQLLANQERRYGVISYGVDLAEETGRQIKGWINDYGSDAPSKGEPDYLGVRLRADSRAVTRWQLDGHTGGLISVGLKGSITGKTLDGGLWVDDPVKNPEQVATDAARDKLWEIFETVLETRLGPSAWTLWTLTRWHEDDPAGRLIAQDAMLPPEKQRVKVLRIPAQCDEPETDPLMRDAGEYLESVQNRPEEWWEHKKKSARVWSALYQGRPTPLMGGIFKWAWIRPYRVAPGDVPGLVRVAVSVDTTGGGHDEAGILVGGRGVDLRTYVLADRSGNYTAGGQWRRAWMAVFEFEADDLVYEANLVDPIMVKAIKATYRRMREQSLALKAAGLIRRGQDGLHITAEVEPHLDQLVAIARTLSGTGDDDVQASDDPPLALAEQLLEVLPYAARILDAPEHGPARVVGVRATRGKRTRAEPVAGAYEDGMVSHVGNLPAYEAQLVQWQEGQDSPDRMDAGVWLWQHLNRSAPATASSPAGGARRVPRGPQVGAPRRRR